jgi:hypothetical protein
MAIIGKAIDYSGARPDLAQVKAFGYTDVYRYTRSKDSSYRLGPTERDQILDAGLDIGIHGEDSAGDAAYGAARGTLRGTAWANYMSTVLHAPKGMTIVAAVDYDTSGQYPNAVDDYLAAVEAAFQGEYRLGVYGSYGVITGAHAAGRGDACYVMTNAWGPDTPPSFCHLHQHGGTPFPETDHNDILRNPRGTWLQTLRGDDMPFTDWPQADQDALADAVWKRGVKNPVSGLVQPAGTRLSAAQAQDDLDKAVAAVLTQSKANGAEISDLQTAIAHVQAAIDALGTGTGGGTGGPLTVSLTGTATPA